MKDFLNLPSIKSKSGLNNHKSNLLKSSIDKAYANNT